MTDIFDLVTVAAGLLKGKTDCEERFYSPGDVPSGAKTLPWGRVRPGPEENEGLGPNGAPQFFTLGTLRITVRVEATGEDDDEEGGATAEAALGRLKRQVEIAIVNAAELMGIVQEFAFIRAHPGFSSEGRMNNGELLMEVGLRYYRGPEQFAPVPYTQPTVMRVVGDLTNVDDPTGTHVPPFVYPVTDPPRTSGPDGRVEIAADVPISQA